MGPFKKYVRWVEGAGGHWKANKNEQGEGDPCIGVRSLFKKECWDFQNEVLQLFSSLEVIWSP